MADESTIATLAATLVSVQENQRDAKDFNMHAFQRIMEKLDVLPKMQTELAVGNEKMTSLSDKLTTHSKADEDMFKGISDKIDKQDGRIEALEKQGWIQKGAAMVVGGLAGLGAGFLHR